MAGRGRKKQSLSKISKWSAAGYTRRSFDYLKEKESETISNQKELISQYVSKEENMELFDFYIDDGYSGTNYNRPDFKRLLKDIKAGNVNAIIVKDLSRLGRNYIESDNYIENIFPMYNVRIISINDNIDSYRDPSSINNISIPIKNLMNDEYAKDISKKVRSAYKSMAERGLFVSGITPYGYMINPNDKHHLVINKEESEIVELIFNKALNGEGRILICKFLNDNGILCRKELQRRLKHNLTLEPFEIESKYIWSTSTIGRMLHNESYIGNLVQLKTTNLNYKNKRIYEKKKEEWIRVENTHEPIISIDVFKKVQKIINDNDRAPKRKTKQLNYSIYNGKLKCADCKKAMNRQEDFRGNRNISNYFCMTFLHLNHKCTSHKIKTSHLEDSVLEAIKLQVKLVIELEKAVERFKTKYNVDGIKQDYKDNIKLLEDKILKNNNNRKKLYENWKLNVITKDEYLQKVENIENDNINIEKELNLLKEDYQLSLKDLHKNEYWIDHYKRNRKIKKVTKEVVNELIDCIYVHENECISVKFKYQNEYERLLNYLKESDNNG